MNAVPMLEYFSNTVLKSTIGRVGAVFSYSESAVVEGRLYTAVKRVHEMLRGVQCGAARCRKSTLQMMSEKGIPSNKSGTAEQFVSYNR